LLYISFHSLIRFIAAIIVATFIDNAPFVSVHWLQAVFVQHQQVNHAIDECFLLSLPLLIANLKAHNCKPLRKVQGLATPGMLARKSGFV